MAGEVSEVAVVDADDALPSAASLGLRNAGWLLVTCCRFHSFGKLSLESVGGGLARLLCERIVGGAAEVDVDDDDDDGNGRLPLACERCCDVDMDNVRMDAGYVQSERSKRGIYGSRGDLFQN